MKKSALFSLFLSFLLLLGLCASAKEPARDFSRAAENWLLGIVSTEEGRDFFGLGKEEAMEVFAGEEGGVFT